MVKYYVLIIIIIILADICGLARAGNLSDVGFCKQTAHSPLHSSTLIYTCQAVIPGFNDLDYRFV